jgi:hypothetical protein
MRSTRSVHLTLLYLVTLITFANEDKSILFVKSHVLYVISLRHLSTDTGSRNEIYDRTVLGVLVAPRTLRTANNLVELLFSEGHLIRVFLMTTLQTVSCQSEGQYNVYVKAKKCG